MVTSQVLCTRILLANSICSKALVDEWKSSTTNHLTTHTCAHTHIHTVDYIPTATLLLQYSICEEILANKNPRMCMFHPHDEPVTHLHRALSTCSIVLHVIRESSVRKHGPVCRIITCTRSSTEPSRWSTGAPLSLEPPLFKQPVSHFSLKVTNNLFLLSTCPSVSAGRFSCTCTLNLSHTLTAHRGIYTGQIGSWRWKEKGSCVRASGAVWVGKWWKRSSFSKLTAPFRIFFSPSSSPPWKAWVVLNSKFILIRREERVTFQHALTVTLLVFHLRFFISSSYSHNCFIQSTDVCAETDQLWLQLRCEKESLNTQLGDKNKCLCKNCKLQ